MRLYNIYKICKEHLEELSEWEIHRNYENGSLVLTIRGWIKAKGALNNLYAVKAFQKTIIEIYEAVPVFYREIDEWKMVQNQKDLMGLKNSLCNKMEGIIEIYESFGYDEPEIGIDIKMPDGDFSDFSNNVKSLEYIFNQCPLLNRDDSNIKFNNVDVGSTWLTFFVVGAGATILAKNIAAIVDKAIAIRSHWNQIKQQEQQLRTMELANDVLETTINSYKVVKEAYVNKALDELKEEVGDYKDGEERDKTRVTIERLIELLDKGMGIYSSINSPEEIQTMFPLLETEGLLQGKDRKLITTSEDK